MRRCIGLDVHREFAQVAIWEDGVIWQAGRIQTTPEALRDFADSLCATDEVALEATGNTHAIARLLERHVGRVVVSNPQKTRAIAEAKVKTDKVDAAVLAGLLAADYLPAVWLPDDATFALRRQVTRRAHIVGQRTRLQEPGPVDPAPQPHRSLPGRGAVREQGPGVAGRPGAPTRRAPGGRGAAAPARLPRPGASHRGRRPRPGRAGACRGPPAHDHPRGGRHRGAGDRGRGRRLRSLLVPAAAGQLSRPQPAGRQSGGQPAQHGRITKQGRAQARGMLVEAAWAAAKTPGRCAPSTSASAPGAAWEVAVVATAGKLATLCWQLVVGNQDYAFARPSLTDKQAPGAGAARRHAAPARAQGPRGRLFPQGGPPTRAGAHRAGRSRLPSARRGLAAQAASDQAPMTS
jgi:transposase